MSRYRIGTQLKEDKAWKSAFQEEGMKKRRTLTCSGERELSTLKQWRSCIWWGAGLMVMSSSSLLRTLPLVAEHSMSTLL